MSRIKSLSILISLAISFGFAQNAHSQWWPATGTDTENEWGSGGWESQVEIYTDRAPLEQLMAPAPDCTGNPKNCQQIHVFKSNVTEAQNLPTHKDVFAPNLNGLGLDCVDGPCPVCPSDDEIIASITADTDATIAVCAIRSDAGFLLPGSVTYCAVDVVVNEVVVGGGPGACVLSRSIVRGEAGAGVFGGSSAVELFASRADAGIDGLPEAAFPELIATNVTGCELTASGTDFVEDCRLPIGLPDDIICPLQGQPNCLSSLFPAVGPFLTGDVFVAREAESLVALRYCVGDVGGDGGNISCQGGDKQVEAAEELLVVFQCPGNHSPQKNALNGTGGNTHKFVFSSECFPELDLADSSTITFETVVDGAITASGITAVNDCQLGGTTTNPTSLTCFVSEADLASGCVRDAPGSSTGRISEIRGRALVPVEIGGEQKSVPLIATDDNGGNGYLCKGLPPEPTI